MQLAKSHPIVAIVVAGSAVYNVVMLAMTRTVVGVAAAVSILAIATTALIGAERLWARGKHEAAMSVVTVAILLSWLADIVAEGLR